MENSDAKLFLSAPVNTILGRTYIFVIDADDAFGIALTSLTTSTYAGGGETVINIATGAIAGSLARDLRFDVFESAVDADGDACTSGDSCVAGACQGIPVPAPGIVEMVSASRSGMIAAFEWNAIAGAEAYDMLRGDLRGWPVGSSPATETCFGDLSEAAASDGDVPPAGEGRWYLVRGRNLCGNGSYGSQGLHGVPGALRESGTCP